MKKLLNFLLLLCVSMGVWAQTFHVSDAPNGEQWADNTYWYYIRNNMSGFLCTADAYTDNGALKLSNSTQPSGDNLEASLWCIVGNETNGYTFYNKAKGTNYKLGILSKNAATLTNPLGGDARAKMYTDDEITNATTGDMVVTTAFTRKTGTDNIKGSDIFCADALSSSVNNRNGYMAYWKDGRNSTGDTGNSFWFIPYDVKARKGRVSQISTDGNETYLYAYNFASSPNSFLKTDLSYTREGTECAKLAIYAGDNDSQYYIKNVSTNKWLSYDNNPANNAKVTTVSSKDEAKQWAIYYNGKNFDVQVVSSSATCSWNWVGGAINNNKLGFWNSGDSGSKWDFKTVNEVISTLGLPTTTNAIKDITDESLFGTLGYPTKAAYDSYKAEADPLVKAALLKALLNSCVYPTTGYYRIKNLQTGYYMQQETSLNNKDIAMLYRSEDRNNNSIWHLTVDPTSHNVTARGTAGRIPFHGNSGESNINNVTTFENKPLQVNWGEASADKCKYGAFYWDGAHSFNGDGYYVLDGKRFVTTWADKGSEGSLWIFEPVTSDELAKIYRISSNRDDITINYTNEEYAGNKEVNTHGFYYWSTVPSTSMIVPTHLKGFKEEISVVENVVTITYTEMTDIEKLQEKIDDVVMKLRLLNQTIGEKEKVGYPKIDNTDFLYMENNYSTISGEGRVTQSNYDEALTHYNNLIQSTDVYLPEDGKAYYFVNYQMKSGTDKTLTGNKWMVKYNDGNHTLGTENYTGQAPRAANIFICHKLNNGKFIFVNEDGYYLRHYSSDHQGTLPNEYASTIELNIEKHGLSEYTQPTINEFLGFCALRGFRSSGKTNSAIVVNGNNGSYDNSDGFLTRYNAANNQYSTAFRIIEATNQNIIKLTRPESHVSGGLNGKYVGTFSAPYTVELPDNIEAYTANVEDDKVVFTKLGDEGKIVPKNTGVLLYAPEAPDNITMNAVPAAVTSLPDVGNNKLIATNREGVTVPAATDAYILANDATKGVKFYILSQSERNIARNKAYLDLTGTSVRSFVFDFEDVTTDIDMNNTDSKQNDVTYDLTGRRINKAYQGIVVRNGKLYKQ